MIPPYYLGPLTGEGKKKEYSYIKLQILRIILGCLWTFKKKNRKKKFLFKKEVKGVNYYPCNSSQRGKKLEKEKEKKENRLKSETT